MLHGCPRSIPRILMHVKVRESRWLSFKLVRGLSLEFSPTGKAMLSGGGSVRPFGRSHRRKEARGMNSDQPFPLSCTNFPKIRFGVRLWSKRGTCWGYGGERLSIVHGEPSGWLLWAVTRKVVIKYLYPTIGYSQPLIFQGGKQSLSTPCLLPLRLNQYKRCRIQTPKAIRESQA